MAVGERHRILRRHGPLCRARYGNQERESTASSRANARRAALQGNPSAFARDSSAFERVDFLNERQAMTRTFSEIGNGAPDSDLDFIPCERGRLSWRIFSPTIPGALAFALSALFGVWILYLHPAAPMPLKRQRPHPR